MRVKESSLDFVVREGDWNGVEGWLKGWWCFGEFMECLGWGIGAVVVDDVLSGWVVSGFGVATMSDLWVECSVISLQWASVIDIGAGF